eukprot:gnl/TRDRNA2_/TRDRNA2_89131_c2_seq1.p1 gnl/TRDRNA2_/TRDRNA2_89131_c2~~gnl/TRDRNA2_/TRDRNA2_89131_c2_seq1.p1  ORF type:complete len:276 (-),score=55.23 gnl/TRDRNA2_/TRDRNA2_89131_c2_seq1:90-845(-)
MVQEERENIENSGRQMRLKKFLDDHMRVIKMTMLSAKTDLRSFLRQVKSSVVRSPNRGRRRRWTSRAHLRSPTAASRGSSAADVSTFDNCTAESPSAMRSALGDLGGCNQMRPSWGALRSSAAAEEAPQLDIQETVKGMRSEISGMKAQISGLQTQMRQQMERQNELQATTNEINANLKELLDAVRHQREKKKQPAKYAPQASADASLGSDSSVMAAHPPRPSPPLPPPLPPSTFPRAPSMPPPPIDTSSH